jgi:phosphohistidine phosphatase
MEIYIVRHGIAEDATRGMPDEKRALTPEGRKKMKDAAAGFAGLKPELNSIFASPLVRAWQTAEILASPLKLDVEEMLELAPGYSAGQVLQRLKRTTDLQSVMLVGHQPNCSELASHLLSNRGMVNVEFKKGAICLIQCESLTSGGGVLLAHYPPSALRSLGGL